MARSQNQGVDVGYIPAREQSSVKINVFSKLLGICEGNEKLKCDFFQVVELKVFSTRKCHGKMWSQLRLGIEFATLYIYHVEEVAYTSFSGEWFRSFKLTALYSENGKQAKLKKMLERLPIDFI